LKNNYIKVAAAVIEREGKILIGRRKKGSHLANRWEFPGGKLEPGETPEEALRRELREELSVEATVGDFVCASRHIYPEKAVELIVYRASIPLGDIDSTDHEEIRWVPREELLLYNFPEADRPVIEILIGATPGEASPSLKD
jgi:8-oxo-dGTP diphosphatase